MNKILTSKVLLNDGNNKTECTFSCPICSISFAIQPIGVYQRMWERLSRKIKS